MNASPSNDSVGGIDDNLAERKSRWGSLLTALEDDWDADDDDGGDSRANGARAAALASPFGGGGALVNQWSAANNNHLAKRGTVALSDWIASRGQRDGPEKDIISARRKRLEDAVRILHSLARKIAGDNHTMNDNGQEEEEIVVHPNFVKVDNVVVVTESAEWAGARGGGGPELSADFVACGDSIFHSDGGDDETRKKYDAMDALGRIAYEVCMAGTGGPSLAELLPPDEAGGAASASDAMDINDVAGDGGAQSMEDEIMEMLCKNARTTTSEENGSGLTSAMLGAGVPFPLCRLVSDLFVDRDGSLFRSERSFTSFADVLSDLRQMMDDPDGFLHASSPDRWRLAFGGRLYGRDPDLGALMDAANRVSSLRHDPIFDMLAGLKGKRREVVMVSGHSGAGKSRLVRVGGTRLEGKGWRFLRCKFDRVVHPEPLSILAYAFDEFFEAFASCPRHQVRNGNDRVPDLECSCPEGSQEIRHRLSETISPEGLGILAKRVPSLRLMLDIRPLSGHIELTEMMMASLFIKLLRVLSSGSTPILFFIDDLQWADPLSLALLPLLVKGNDLQLSLASNCDDATPQGVGGAQDDEIRVMFVGSYRDNEVSGVHPLAKVLRKFEEDKSVNLTSIRLSRFDLETLNLMLSESLCVPARRVRPLSELVIQKTDGQPLHVIEFVQALAADSLLTHSFERGWEWDADSIDICSISDSVAELYAFKLHRLPGEVLRGMQILSCFGSQIDQQVLEFAADYDGDGSVDIEAAIRVALSEGLVERAAHLVRFAHDAIQKATLDSIGDDDLPSLLRKLAAAIIKNAATADKLDSVLFVVVDLINRVGSERTPERSRAQFAKLNLRAASTAIEVPDFSSAAVYAEHGIAFLGDDCWEAQYDLSIRLYETAVLAHFSSLEGERDKLTSRIESVFEHARDSAHKFTTHCVWINVLAMTDLAKAIEESLRVLEMLGEPLNVMNVDPKRVQEELMKYTCHSGGDRKKDLLSAKRMTDRNKIRAMKVMASLMTYYHQMLSLVSVFVGCQMMKLTLKHGHCEHSIFAAASIASSLLNLEAIDESNAWGRTTLSLMHMYNNDGLIPPVYSALYGIVFVWKEPMQSTLEPLAEAIRVSFARGQVEFAVNNTIFYVYRCFISGKGCRILIGEVAALARQHGNNFDSSKPVSLLHFYTIPLYKVLCDLEGEDNERMSPERDLAEPRNQLSALERLGERPAFPLNTATLIDADEMINAGLGRKQLSTVVGVLAYQTTKALFFRDMDNALKYTDLYFEHFVETHKTGAPMLMKYNEFYHVFMEALITFYFRRQTGEDRYLARGEHALSKMKKWATHSEWNWKNKMLLMEAEYLFAQERFDQAASRYEASIKAAREHKFIHEEALGSELAAMFFLERGLREKAHAYFKHSLKCYEKWGAYAVAKRIADVMKNEFGSDSIQTGSTDEFVVTPDSSTKAPLKKRSAPTE